MDWATSSDKARANGAFYKTKGRVVELLPVAFAADETIASNRSGAPIGLGSWIKHAHRDAVAKEMLVQIFFLLSV